MAEIETRLFRYFVTLAQERHFARAAMQLDISPPTLTHQIKKLEVKLGTKLFERNGNSRVELTDSGQRMLKHARNVLHEVEVAKSVVQQAALGEIGRLDVGFMIIAALAGLISTLIGGFRRANPAIEINLQQMTTLSQIDAILNKKMDFGFVRPHEAFNANLGGFVVCSLPMVVALSCDHPLALNKRIKPSVLKTEPFVNTSADLDIDFWEHTDAVGNLGGFTPKIVKRASNVISILSYVSAGQGVAIVSQGFKRIDMPNVVYREFDTETPPMGPIAFVYRRDDLSPAENALIAYVKAHAPIT
jgi:DNA-binding transcriptional LysR family regulator